MKITRRALVPSSALAPLALALFSACANTPRADEGAPAPVTRTVRITSYNIKHGLGMDGRLDLARVAAVLAATMPDVVLLQEVDERTGRAHGVDQAAALAEALGMRPSFASFMDFDGGRYGLAILSRLPVLAAEPIELPPGRQEPRTALAVTLDVAGERLVVANAHLDWLEDPTERLAQARTLAAALALSGDPVVLGGDLNDVPDSAALRVFTAERGFKRLGPSAATFPADVPTETIDHFLTRGVKFTSATEVAVMPEPLVSDHRPVTLALVYTPY